MARRILATNLPGHEGEVRKALAEADINFTELYSGGVSAPQGRLTLATQSPVMTASVPGATAVIYTPYKGQLVPIYDGANFSMVDTGGELSQLTTDAGKSPAAVAATSVYDMFVWNDRGAIRCTRGPAWTNTTTRSLALVRVRGILTNSAAITNGPAQNQGTYVGTISSNASGTIDYIYGTAASGGGAAVLNVWNYYNRVSIATRVTDTQPAYTYTTATTRQAGGSAGNQIAYTVGVAEDSPCFQYQIDGQTAAAVGATLYTSIGDDSITVMELVAEILQTPAVVTLAGTMNTTYCKGMVEPIAGLHYAAALERGDGVNANTFNYLSGSTLTGCIRM